jgi:hypothetical protein
MVATITLSRYRMTQTTRQTHWRSLFLCGMLAPNNSFKPTPLRGAA